MEDNAASTTCGSPLSLSLCICIYVYYLGFDENELESHELLEDSQLVPLRHYRVHVRIGHEETDNTIRNYLGKLQDEPSKVFGNARVLSIIELGRDGLLIRPSRNDDRADALPSERHRQTRRYDLQEEEEEKREGESELEGSIQAES